MHHLTRAGTVALSLSLTVVAVIGTAVAASASMRTGCSVYAESVYRSGGSTYFAGTATCGTNAWVSYARSELERTGGVRVLLGPAKTSTGATSLRSASSSTSCVPGYAYRSYAWGQDNQTGASETAGAYTTLC